MQTKKVISYYKFGVHMQPYSYITRPQGIILQILLIMLFRTSPKNPSLYAHYYSFYAPHCYYYSIKLYQYLM